MMKTVAMPPRKSTMGHSGNGLIMPRLAGFAGILLMLLGQGAVAVADEIRLPIAENLRDGNPQGRPEKGNSMDAVESRFGEPQRRTSPIGRPPISQWHYTDFVVYFENSHVIHSVARHQGR